MITQISVNNKPIKFPCKKCGKPVIWTSMFGDTHKECIEKLSEQIDDIDIGFPRSN